MVLHSLGCPDIADDPPLHPHLILDHIMDYDSAERKREIAEQKERARFKRRKFEQEKDLHDAEYYEEESEDDLN